MQGRNPFDMISTHLVEIISRDIMYTSYPNLPYLSLIPLGWYAAEYTVSIEDIGTEEFVSCLESIVVYDFNSHKYEELIDSLMKINLDTWSNEALEDDDLLAVATSLAAQFFNNEEDNLDENLYSNIVKIIRHIAQNGSTPEFVNFNERNVYDLDRIALQLIDTSPRECHAYLMNLFNNEGKLWKLLYGNSINFKKAFDHAVNRILIGTEIVGPITGISKPEHRPMLLTDEIKQQVYKRDNYQCLCCGKERRKGVSLEIDHVLPIAMGGKNAPSNLQTLCKQCNGIKGVNEIDYSSIISPLSSPKEMILFECSSSDYVENIIARIVNHVYHCKAFCNLEHSQRRNGKNYHTWIINLYYGNNPKWLESNIPSLLEYVQRELGWDHVENIIIKG
jgi:hypothetical protein